MRQRQRHGQAGNDIPADKTRHTNTQTQRNIDAETDNWIQRVRYMHTQRSREGVGEGRHTETEANTRDVQSAETTQVPNCWVFHAKHA